MEDSGMELTRYEAARHALAEAQRVDEVKNIRDKALAMQAYAKQAKDRELIDNATEIRMRAEIRAGELLKEMANKGERQKPGDNPKGRNGSGSRPLAPTLSDIGISKSQSSRWQRLAALPLDKQEEKIALAKKKASSVIVGVGRVKTTDEPRSKTGAVPKMTNQKRCAQKVKAIVLAAMNEMQVGDWPELFQELRREIEHLEAIAKQKRANGNDRLGNGANDEAG